MRWPCGRAPRWRCWSASCSDGLAGQAQQPLAGQREQDLLGATGDGQAAGVEEVVHGLVLDDARAFRQLHPELRERLPIAHANQLARAGFCAGVLTTDRQLSDALVEQRADLSRPEARAEAMLLASY